MKIEKILFPTDFSECSQAALPWAVRLSSTFRAELHLLHGIVLHDYGDQGRFPDSEEVVETLLARSEADLAALYREMQLRAPGIHKAHRHGTSAAPLILDYMSEEGIDLIVMSTHGRRGLRHLLIGSVAEEVVRRANCPVLTVRPGERQRNTGQLQRLLVPIDFSDQSRAVLGEAKELAAEIDGELLLVHVVDPPTYPVFYGELQAPDSFYRLDELKEASRRALEELYEKGDRPDGRHQVIVGEGKPAREIVRLAKERSCDLIVIGSHGLTGLWHLLLGSVAEEVVRTSEAPVWVVKGAAEQDKSSKDNGTAN